MSCLLAAAARSCLLAAKRTGLGLGQGLVLSSSWLGLLLDPFLLFGQLYNTDTSLYSTSLTLRVPFGVCIKKVGLNFHKIPHTQKAIMKTVCIIMYGVTEILPKFGVSQ